MGRTSLRDDRMLKLHREMLKVACCILTLLSFEAFCDQSLLEAPPMVSAQAWLVAEADSGAVLHGLNEDAPRQLASLTKIMTALVVLDVAARHPELLEQQVMVSAMAAAEIGTTALLETGDRLTIEELLYAMMLPSGNDAATALAEYVGRRLDHLPGVDTVQRFVAAMNQTAAMLKMDNTSFIDVHGMGTNLSSAADLLVLTRRALQYPLFRKIIVTAEKELSIPSIQGRNRQVTWRNTNELLAHGFSGVKTGHTNVAGGCLVLLGEFEGESHLVIVLESANERSRFADAYNLYQWSMLKAQLSQAGVPAMR